MTTTAIRAQWTVLPTSDGPSAREGVTVVIDNDRVIEVLERSISADRTIDAPGQVLVPGFINSHTHIGVSPMGRGIVEDRDYTGRPFYMAISAVSGIAYEPEQFGELHALMQADLLGLMRSGVSCIVAQNALEVGYLLGLLTESGIRAYCGPILPSSPIARGVLDEKGNVVRQPVPPEVLQAEVNAAIALHARYDQGREGRIRVLAGPASAETCPDELLLEMARLNAEWGVPLTLHLAQSEHDVEQAHQMFGTSSTGHLAELGLLGPNLIAAHGSLLTDDDVRLLRDAGATVAHCATRKAKEAVFSPFERYRAEGLRVTLANDSFTTDFIEEIRFAAMLGKLAVGGAARPTARTALAGATELGGDALGRGDLGRIAPGSKADLTLVDLSNPFVSPVYDPIASLVYYASGLDVDSVWIDGQPVVQGGKVLTLDAERIRRDAIEAANIIWRIAKERGRL